MSGPPPLPPSMPSWATQKPSGTPSPGTRLDQQYEAFIGPRWETYRRKFRPFFEEPRFQPTWNWAAALGSPFWFFYRKLPLMGAALVLLPNIIFSLLWEGDPPKVLPDGRVDMDPDMAVVLLGVVLSMIVLAGGTANWLLFRRAQVAIRLAESPDMELSLDRLTRLGGVSWRSVLVVFAVLFTLNTLAMMAGK